MKKGLVFQLIAGLTYIFYCSKMVSEWIDNLKFKDKSYIHFDIRPDLNKGIKVSGRQEISPQVFFEDFLSPKNVAKRGFWPLIHFTKTEKKFKFSEEDRDDFFFIKPKEREIFYASHFDSYILSYYAYLLGLKYDEILTNSGLDERILAYRHIPIGKDEGGKNNVYFSRDIFEEITNQDNCMVFAFDITGFFDNLNHSYLKDKICEIIGEKRLPDDYYNMFKFVSNYDYIEKEFIEENNLIIKTPEGSIINKDKFHILKSDYKKKNGKSLIKKNEKKVKDKVVGVAQGTPISGMLANIYMLDFDKTIQEYIGLKGGKYYRYSDDILVIVPLYSDEKTVRNEVTETVFEKIKDIHLVIQQKKTDIYLFENKLISKSFHFDDVLGFIQDKHTKPLQYLGFTFNGKNVLIRNKTLSTYYKKMMRAIKRLACLKPEDDSKSKIKGEKIFLGKLNKRFTNAGSIGSGSKYGNFLGYVYKSYEIMDGFCSKFKHIKNGIKKQVARHQNIYNKNLKIKGLK